jgi:Phosphotransferase enzyme family
VSSRNEVLLVQDHLASCVAAIKQFGPSDHDLIHYTVEANQLQTGGGSPFPTLLFKDDDWRVLILRGEQVCLADLIRAASPTIEAGPIFNALEVIHARPAPVGELPGVIGWFIRAQSPDGLGVAANRVFQTAASHRGLVAAAQRLHEWWQPEGLCHGDLKAEHIFIRDDQVVVVDWDSSTAGPAIWDWAGLLQSQFSIAIAGHLEWTPDHRRLAFQTMSAAGADIRRLADATAIRMIQTAIEWETGRSRPRMTTGPLVQMAADIADHPLILNEICSP